MDFTLIMLIIVLVLEIAIAFEFKSVAEAKGYDGLKYLLWCIFFPPGGYLLVIALPIMEKAVVEVDDDLPEI